MFTGLMEFFCRNISEALKLPPDPSDDKIFAFIYHFEIKPSDMFDRSDRNAKIRITCRIWQSAVSVTFQMKYKL